MSILHEMMDSGFVVDWTTILVGWDCPGNYPSQLSVADVSEHATHLLEANPDQPSEVLHLASTPDGSGDEFDQCIRRLAAHEGGDVVNETRNWRLFLLKRVMKTLGQDPIYGLLKLTEFWSGFDYPADSPHVVQGRHNALSPPEYYSDDMFRQIVHAHEEWINREESLLKPE